MTEISKTKITVDGFSYPVVVQQKKYAPKDAPRIVISAYQPNENAANLTKLTVRSIRENTTIPYELWVVDNNSPWKIAGWMLDEPELNVLWSHRTPVAPSHEFPWLRAIRAYFSNANRSKYAAYENGLAIQIAVDYFSSDVCYMGILHNDVLICKAGWLQFLMSKLDETHRAVSARYRVAEDGVKRMVPNGMIVDLPLVKQINSTMLPNMPAWDAVERISMDFKKNEIGWYLVKNSHNDPAFLDNLAESNPYYHFQVDRCFDDEGDVIFMHLGRGSLKATNQYLEPGKTNVEQWVDFAANELGIHLSD